MVRVPEAVLHVSLLTNPPPISYSWPVIFDSDIIKGKATCCPKLWLSHFRTQWTGHCAGCVVWFLPSSTPGKRAEVTRATRKIPGYTVTHRLRQHGTGGR